MDRPRRGGWRLRWLAWRNRLIGNPAFQRRVSMSPFTAWIARRHARGLFDLTAGFVYSQVTAALVDSGLVEALARTPRTLAEAAQIADLDLAAAHTLMTAAASLGLTEFADDQWTLGERGAALAATPGLTDMIRHHRLLYQDLADPLAMLRGDGPGRLAALWHYGADSDPADAATYSRLMSATQPLVAQQALAAYPFARHRRLLDIGGGEGAFLCAVSEVAPALELGLFDRPQVLENIGTSGRQIQLHPGDFRLDPLPAGYDLHTLVRVLHDHDDDVAQALLNASRAALGPGGRLLIVEPMATLGRAPEGHAYFGFYLAAMRSGRPREAREIKAMLRRAGFGHVHERATPLPLAARCLVAIP